MKTYKILGLLLSYPAPETMGHLSGMADILGREKILTGRHLKGVLTFIDVLGRQDVIEAQERYVDTFDRGRAHSLHLFEHVHGESRERGQAMVDLAELYKSKGLFVSRGELPDYLPLFLEYLSLCTPEEAKSLLEETAHIVAAVGAKLRRKDSAYVALFDAIVALSEIKANVKLPETEAAEDIDKEWEEPPAFAGTDCKGCGTFTNTSEAIAKALGEAK